MSLVMATNGNVREHVMIGSKRENEREDACATRMILSPKNGINGT